MTEHHAIPKEVASAIVAVMSGIKTLGKEDTNKFQKYDFASVDKFLAAVGPLCAAAGLVIFQEEESVEIATRETTDDYGKTKSSSWLTVRYAFLLAHSSGASYGPIHRSVMVPANGAQAFGSAQSYALKQFMRAQFQIPTGDADDADHGKAEHLPHSRPTQETGARQGGGKDQSPFSDGQHGDDVGEAKLKAWTAWGAKFRHAVTEAPSYGAARELWNAKKADLDRLKAELPDLYRDLEEWCKTATADKPKEPV